MSRYFPHTSYAEDQPVPHVVLATHLVEWQDRSWRLLENRGQLEMDDWTYLGMGAGVAAAWAAGSLKGLGGRGVMGAVGAGGVVGGLAWAGWRFGVNGGRFKEKPKEGDL
ncbi:hypothetical protein MAJ_05455, partial [Metarhizium majus ARSEF 297]